MRNSTYWSLFCLALALVNMRTGRDIAANTFLGALMVIQGLSRDSMTETHQRRVRIVLTGLSIALIAFAILNNDWKLQHGW